MRIPKLTRHASGQSVVRISGVDYYCGKHGDPKTEAKYRGLIAEWLANKQTFEIKKQPKKTIEDLSIAYLEYAKAYYEPKEYNNIRLIVQTALALYRELDADTFSSTEFKTVRTQFANDKILRTRSRQYVNKCMACLIRMFSWCTGEGLVKPDVVAVLREIPALRKGKTTVPESPKSRLKSKLVPQAIVDATLPHLPQVVADMVRLQQLLGCRPGELCGIKPAMIDRNGEVWTIQLDHHKTEHHDQERTLYAGPKSQAILTRYLDRPLDAFCFSPGEAMAQHRAKKSADRTTPPNQGNRSGYNQCSRAGAAKARYNDQYTTSSYGHSISRACKATWPAPEGLDAEQTRQWHARHRWTPHQLRHAAGQEIRIQFGLEHVAAVLGHADIETSKIYSTIRAAQAIEAAKTR